MATATLNTKAFTNPKALLAMAVTTAVALLVLNTIRRRVPQSAAILDPVFTGL